MSRTIDYLPLGDLKPDPRNPKDHDVGLIHTSVGRFGFVEPIVLDGRTGLIVSGHGRVKALEALEKEGGVPPEGVTVDQSGRWLAPVAIGWESRNDAEAAAALIAMNRTTEMGGWVDESLFKLLDQLSTDDALEGIGYDAEDVESLRSLLEGQAETPAIPPGEFPEYGDDIAVEHTCPSCGYAWSGGSSSKIVRDE